MCVCPSSETRRKRDHTEGEEGIAVMGPLLLFMVYIFFLVMLTVVQRLSVRRRCEAASERVERGREWERFVFFVRGTTEGSRRTHRLPIRIWCVFSWQRRWLGVCVPTARDLCSLKCGTSRVGTTRKWQTCWCKNSVDYNSALEQSFLWIQG